MQIRVLMCSVIVLGTFACNGSKRSKKPELAPPQNGQDLGSFDDSFQDCASQSVSQSADDCSNAGDQALRLTSRSSARGEAFFGPIENGESCLSQVRVNRQSIELNLTNIDLRDGEQGQAQLARCVVDLGLAMRKGYAFALRRVSLGLDSDLANDAVASFKGVYSFQNQGNFAPLTVLANVPGPGQKTTNLVKKVEDQALVWSPCSGSANLRIDTLVSVSPIPGSGSLEFPGSLDLGIVAIKEQPPYRLELVWKACTP